MKKLAEIQTQLHDEFVEWFAPMFLKWENEMFEKLKPKVKEVISNDVNPSDEINKMDIKFLMDKIQFIKQAQYQYFDIVLDQYNDKKITKRTMNIFCQELTEGIKETDKALEDMKEKYKL